MGQCINKSIIMPENAQKFVFTRYLYIKDEVKLILLTSILNKSNKSLFWAYELYYSGFKTELFDLLWKIYFDFYYTLNPAFYNYFTKKHKEWEKMSESPEQDKIIGIIVSDLLIRPHNLDVFMLRHIVQNFDIDLEIDSESTKINFDQLIRWLDSKNYLIISEFILNNCKLEYLDDVMQYINTYFKDKGINVDKYKYKFTEKNRQNILLAHTMLMFTLLEKLTMGKKLYLIIDDDEITPYKNRCELDDSPYKVLPRACLHAIDEYNYLSLFALQRDAVNLKSAYYYHWEYHASFSPIWLERIIQYNGVINHATQKIDFPDDESFEAFYDSFNYEPDEQKIEVQNKSIQQIKPERTWAQFYKEHKNVGLFIPSNEYFEEFGKVEY